VTAKILYLNQHRSVQAAALPRARRTDAYIERLPRDAVAWEHFEMVSELARDAIEQAPREYGAFKQRQAVENARRASKPSAAETILSDHGLNGPFGYRAATEHFPA
jgi:hypothetical protein